MNQRWLDRMSVVARTISVRRPLRAGRVRIGIVIASLVVAGGAAYTVRPGDTLSELAARFDISVNQLTEVNSITNPDLIVVGQVLTIPGQSGGGAAPSQPGPSSSGGGEASTHVVKPGESLSAIAHRYGLSVKDLARANGITDVNKVWAGSLLRVAGNPPPTPGGGGSGGGGKHTIAKGESLSSIAVAYGTTVAALVKANGLDDANRIFAGQTLKVPGGGGGGWTCPVAGSRYVNDFGTAKPDGRFHEGIDVFASRGTLIKAPVGGRIEHVQGSRGGLQFVLKGDDGYTYIGTHLDSYGPSGRVERGTPIGTVGTTGNARGTSPHLHFEMHHGSVVNPYATLKKSC